MTEPGFLRDWTIRSSSSRFFPIRSEIQLIPRPEPEGFELEVTWEKHAKLKLLEKDFLPDPDKPGTLKGSFCHPKGKPPEEQEEFELVVVACPVSLSDGKRRLLGLLLQTRGRIGDEGTGVWVAEAKPPQERPGGST